MAARMRTRLLAMAVLTLVAGSVAAAPPDVNALATILVLLVATGIAISTVWMGYQQRRRERDLQLAAAANL